MERYVQLVVVVCICSSLGQGHVTLRPEDDEDMWHLYNLIQEGDSVRAAAIRCIPVFFR